MIFKSNMFVILKILEQANPKNNCLKDYVFFEWVLATDFHSKLKKVTKYKVSFSDNHKLNFVIYKST